MTDTPSLITREMQRLVSRSSLGAADVVRVRRTTPPETTKKIVNASRTVSNPPVTRT